MTIYFLKRLLLIIPTIFGIMLLNFLIIQLAPGGPVEQTIAKIKHSHIDANANINQAGLSDVIQSDEKTKSGLPPELIKEIEVLYGFDKPIHIRFFDMIKRYISFDFGDSFFKNSSVIEIIKDKLPVSISLGLWTTFLTYLISIPLGIKKAVKNGSNFDLYTSTIIIIGYAIPAFLFGILLIVLFAGGSYFTIFPLKGLTSDNFAELSWWQQILDYLWHLFLPVLTMVIGSFATLTMLAKNSFLEEINKQYVITALAKGVSKKRVLYKHIFRNAMLIIIAGFPMAFIGAFFTGSLLIETIFSLDGLGLLSFESVISRDYPIVFASLYIFSLLGLVLKLISDFTYTLIDPRIDFERG